MGTLCSVMTALLIGLLVVTAGAAGTWLTLFRLDPARQSVAVDSRPLQRAQESSPVPSRFEASSDVRVGLGRRIRSTVILLAIVLSVAACIGAVISAVLVLAVALFA